jgi:hypothetical protein
MAGSAVPDQFNMYAIEGVDNEDQGVAAGGVRPDRLILMGNVDDPLLLQVDAYSGASASTISLADGSFEQYPYLDTDYASRLILILPNPAAACRKGDIRQISAVPSHSGGANEVMTLNTGLPSTINPPSARRTLSAERLLGPPCTDTTNYHGGTVMFVDVKEYWLDITGGMGLPVSTGYIGVGGVLYQTKNGVHNPVAQNIENFQVEYNGDFNADGLLDGFLPWNNSWTLTQVSYIRQVRALILDRQCLRRRFRPSGRQHPSLPEAGPLQFPGRHDGRPAAPVPVGIDVQYPEPVLESLQSRRAVKPSIHNVERGSSLIVVIMVVAFMLAVGIALLTITGTAPKASGSVRNQEEAFNTAEAGFDAARIAVERNFFDGTWTNLPDNCLQTPMGIDLPLDANYFRKKTDAELIAAPAAGGIPLPTANNGVVFKDQPFLKIATGGDDLTRTYTVFLIDDEADTANGAVPDPSDALLICIGVVRAGNRVLSTSRLEILIGIQVGGTKP